MFSEILAVLVKEAEIRSVNHPLRFYIQLKVLPFMHEVLIREKYAVLCH